MKIDRINYTHTYQIGLTQWQKIGLEASIDDTEDPKECLSKLEQEAHDFHRKSNPSLYKNGNEALVDGFIPVDFDGGGFFKQPKVINRLYERLEMMIENCTTLEELEKFNDSLPVDLRPAYNNKKINLETASQ
jgi:hypothetical protein